MNVNRSVPDELLGAAVRAAQQELNATIARAWEAGLRIDVTTHHRLEIAHEYGCPIVSVNVSRPI